MSSSIATPITAYTAVDPSPNGTQPRNFSLRKLRDMIRQNRGSSSGCSSAYIENVDYTTVGADGSVTKVQSVTLAMAEQQESDVVVDEKGKEKEELSRPPLPPHRKEQLSTRV